MGKLVGAVAILVAGAALLVTGASAGGSSQAKATGCGSFIALDSAGPLLGGNPSMRRAINWALDRRALVPDGFAPWTHVLLPGERGAVTAKGRQPYSPGPNYTRAQKLAAGHFRDGKIIVAYRTSQTGTTDKEKDLVVQALERIGFKSEDIVLRAFPGVDIYDMLGHSKNWDLALSLSECNGKPGDPYTVLSSTLLHPGQVRPLVGPKYRKRILGLRELHGKARARAAGKLDLKIMRNVAPIAILGYFKTTS